MRKEIEIPEGYEARIEDNKVIIEPKESDDERIRKDIVAAVEMRGDLTQGRKSEIYAYLEKQKEQKPVISDEAIRDGVIHFGITQYQIDNWLKNHINVIEQKPAEWSEEDTNFLNRTLSIIRWASHSDRMSRIIGDEGAIELENWLKSLCPQPHWKPSKEQLLALKMHSPVHVPDIHLASLYDDLLKLL